MQKPQRHILRERDAKRLSRVYLEVAKFDERAKEDISKIPLPDIDEQVQEMWELAERNRVELAAVMQDGKRIGTFVYSVLQLYGKRTLWIVGIGADIGDRSEGEFLFPALGFEIRRLAEAYCCDWVRADTSRPPIFALLVKLGFLPGTVQLYYPIKR